MAKGAQWERDFARKLSLCWTKGKYDDRFWRSDGSGGRATNRSKKGKLTHGQYGDIRASHPEGHDLIDTIIFELKRGYSNKSVQDLIDRPDHSALQTIEEWIIKAENSKQFAGATSWAIILRRDKREPMVIFPYSMVACQIINNPLPYLRAVLYVPIRYKKGKQVTKRLYCVLLDDFLHSMDRGMIRHIARTKREEKR